MKTQSSTTTPSVSSPDIVLATLLDGLQPLPPEPAHCQAAIGRVLADGLVADRDSPPADVSAMDGFALRMSDLAAASIPIAGEVTVGEKPPDLPAGHCLRVFTGSCIPLGAELVVRFEDTEPNSKSVVLKTPSQAWYAGMHVRRRAENLQAGQTVIHAGTPLTSAVASAMAAFGQGSLSVYGMVRVAVITTGNEVQPFSASPEAWHIRDSNGPALRTLFADCPWLEVSYIRHVPDQLAQTHRALVEALDTSDAVFLTGGVSGGAHDYVPDAIVACGGHQVFRTLPIRPGKPILGALGPTGQPILALPGNPVAALITARRFGVPVLRKLAGYARPFDFNSVIKVDMRPDVELLPLWWYRPVRVADSGVAEIVSLQGSGDIVGIARSDGFVEVPPHTNAAGLRRFWPWRI